MKLSFGEACKEAQNQKGELNTNTNLTHTTMNTTNKDFENILIHPI